MQTNVSRISSQGARTANGVGAVPVLSRQLGTGLDRPDVDGYFVVEIV